MTRVMIPTAFVLGALALAGLVSAEQPKEKDKPKPKDKAKERPAQTPVLGKTTVAKTDVRYGDDEKQRLDVYSPRGAKGAAVVVFVHGGEWTRGDKANVSYKPKFLNDNGVVFVSINYRLTPEVKHPAHVSDVAAAVAWVRGHAEEIGADPKKVVLMGHSAGCHLATLAALDPRYLGKAKLKPGDLAGVVAWSGGAFDLVEKVKGGGSYPEYIKKAFGDSESVWKDASPLTHAKNAKGGPRFLFVSVEGGSASHKAAERLAKAIKDAGGKAGSKVLEGRDHFGANHLLGAPDDRTGKILLDFVREATKR